MQMNDNDVYLGGTKDLCILNQPEHVLKEIKLSGAVADPAAG